MDIILEELSANLPIATTADLTYYVSTSGSDTLNNGLTASTPFKTIRKAISRIPYMVDHMAIINIADGEYTENVEISGYAGTGSINLIGDIETPSNVQFLTLDVSGCYCLVKVAGIRII